MFLPWLKISAALLTALGLSLLANPKNMNLFIGANISAILSASYAGISLRKLQKYYEDTERVEDMLAALKDTQATEQLQYLSSAAERKRSSEEADKETERQLNLLQQTAPLFSEVLALTGQNGAVSRMALGMIQNGEPLGNVLLATSEAEMQLETAKLQAQIHQRQLALQAQQFPVTSEVVTVTPSVTTADKEPSPQ